MEESKIKEVLADPSARRVIEGLRDTGYTFTTAICDIVDNSITAEATKINIFLQLREDRIEPVVYIVDNGFGMSPEKIVPAMTYGSTATAEDDKLGKFGLGLKTASTAFCRDLTVVSKADGYPITKAEWDLDYIAKVNKWVLKRPDPNEDEIEILEDLTGRGSHGTLVKWSKVDRLLAHQYERTAMAQKAIASIKDNLIFHLRMTYQRYLDPENTDYPTVEIFVNGERVNAWDPFGTSFDGTTRLVPGTTNKVNVTMPDGSQSTITIEGYILPRKDELNVKESKEAKISNDLQGFYIYREGRLIHCGDWFGMYTKEPHSSLLRVNLSFGKELDALFNVDIKKSRILLNEELYQYLNRTINPWKREAENRYRTGQRATQRSDAASAHDIANKEIEKQSATLEAGTQVIKTDKKNGTAVIRNPQGTFEKRIVIQEEGISKGRIIPVPSLDGMLWQPTLSDGKPAVEINENHPFYAKVYGPIIKNNPVVQGIDYLLWAMVAAENETYTDEAKEYCEDFRRITSDKLRKLVRDLPDPENDTDN